MTRGREHIVAVAIKHAAAADVVAPLFWRLRQAHPDRRLTMLYCALSRRQVMRVSRFYETLFRELDVRETDFLDYASPRAHGTRHLWRRLLTANPWDLPKPGSAQDRWRRALGAVEQRIAQAMDADDILRQLAPDFVLWDNRTSARFPGSRGFRQYLAAERKRTVLLPHAPHHSYRDAFTPFDRDGATPLPEYCDYWTPFIDDAPWEKMPRQRDQFFLSGYPGLDSSWLSWLRGRAPKRSGRLRCLFIIREFRGLESRRAVDDDPFIFHADEFLRYRDLVARALANADVELIVKPHPSNKFKTVRQAFAGAGFKRLAVTYESIYTEIPRCDFVISLYSTTLLVPAMAGIPVVLLNSRVQEHVHGWEALRRLYTGLTFFLEDPESLPRVLPAVLDAARAARARGAEWMGDRSHLRSFYPDGALERCLSRLGFDN